MAYEAPTPTDLKAVFPVFANVPDATIQFALTEAGRRTSDQWPDEDRRLGVMLYAAHTLTMDGQGSSNEAQFGAFKRLKIGSLELEKATSGADAAMPGSLRSTSFGVRFQALASRLFPAVLVV
ncbi:DUF4054 domain-containing protein [Aureimonas ureilytica]|uniref:DUF4054 domain-containing protein n=1 Tax=Aureimonas ureilytica TaxID=401562 RepID=UPI003CE9520D